MNMKPVARPVFAETNGRAIAKTISWRIIATFTTAVLVYIFVGRVDVAAAVGGLEMIAKMILYFFHERGWNYIHFGKKEVKPFVLWFTGLSGSGKSTLAELVHQNLEEKGYRVERLDGDTIRSIFPSTGFTKEERDSHVKRVGYLASMLEKNGVIVISSFISPYLDTRNFVRNMCNNFVEVFVDASLDECEKRDVKGLYKRARAGEIDHFTGIDDPYECPENPEITVSTENLSVDQSLEIIMKGIRKYLQ